MSNFLHNTAAVVKVLFARARFLSVFLVAALVVGYWDNIKNHWDKWTRPAVAPEAGLVSDVEYYCPMHPNVIRPEAGKCPSCGMPLVKRKKGETEKLPADVLARVRLTPQRVTLAGIRTSGAEYRQLVRETRAVGVLDYNETKVAQLSARVAGRADQLSLQYVGQAVKNGDPAYSLYSPEVYTALREYLMARKRVNDLAADAPADAKADVTAVFNASLQKLVLWGVTSDELNRVDEEFKNTGQIPTHLTVTSPISGIVIKKELFEGGYVNVGDRPYTIADLGVLWMKAKIYEQDVPLVRIGQQVDLVVEAYPNEKFKGTVTFMAYQLDAQTRTMDARIEVKNADLRLRPGMFANAWIVTPVVETAAPAPATIRPNGAEATVAHERAKMFAAALKPYLEAHKLLAADKEEGVAALLGEVAAKLAPMANDAALGEAVKKVGEAAGTAKGQSLKDIRKTYLAASMAMTQIGKALGVPEGSAEVQVFRCAMYPGDWLQDRPGTVNPYDSEMATCGVAIEKLPKVAAPAAATTRPAGAAGRVLAIPRSAVVDTGRQKIVYAEAKDPKFGTIEASFDMRALKLGALAKEYSTDGKERGEYYPVLEGLKDGERVVTEGAFLVDAENRLNPAR